MIFRLVLTTKLHFGQFKQPAAGKNFKDFVLKVMVKTQFGNGSSYKSDLSCKISGKNIFQNWIDVVSLQDISYH